MPAGQITLFGGASVSYRFILRLGGVCRVDAYLSVSRPRTGWASAHPPTGAPPSCVNINVSTEEHVCTLGIDHRGAPACHTAPPDLLVHLDQLLRDVASAIVAQHGVAHVLQIRVHCLQKSIENLTYFIHKLHGLIDHIVKWI